MPFLIKLSTYCSCWSVPFINSQGQACLMRHPVNRDSFEKVKESYVVSVLNGGLIEGVRGQAWAIPDSSSQAPGNERWFLISHATLTEAIYLAQQREPSNRFVIKSLEMGIQAKVFHPNCPKDVCAYLRDLHNLFHKGASITHLEMVERVESITVQSRIEKCEIICQTLDFLV